MALPPRFAETARERFEDKALDNWRTDARDDYAFVHGDQWLSEDAAELREQRRPALTFNYSAKNIDAVIGAEVNNRQEVAYKPRGMEDAALGELYTNGAKWARQQCGAEFEESDAFADMLTCGLGWIETRMDYMTVPDGRVLVERIDPLEMRYDPAANRRCLTDMRWVSREWWVNEDDAKRTWPGKTFPTSSDDSTGTSVIRRGDRYSDGTDIESDIHKGQVLIRHYQTFVNEPYHRVASGDKMEELDMATFKALQPDLERLGVESVKQYRKVYYRAYFAGETLLEGDKSPCQHGFTFTPITGKRDRNKNTWYGINRVQKDPQRWTNKWLSQILYIINSNAKGGLMAEEAAFVDPRKAQDEWAKPDSITLLSEGGIDKVREKGQSALPSGLFQLMEFAISSLPMVTGINLEALGLANREQAGVLEDSRKKAAYGILAPYFDTIRLYRQLQGRTLLYYLRNYLSDGRWIRIDAQGQQALQLSKTPDNVEYDIIVDQSPASPDSKQTTWDTLSAIIPGMLKAGTPIPPDVLDYLPLPSALVQKWKQFAAQAAQSAQGPSPEQLKQMQSEMQKLQQQNQQAQMALKDKSAELQLKAQEATAELALKEQEMQATLRLEREKAAAEFELEKAKLHATVQVEGMKAAADSEREGIKLAHDVENTKRKVDADMKIKAIEAGIGKGDFAFTVDSPETNDALEKMAETQSQLVKLQEQIAESLAVLTETIQRPKVATMPDGRKIRISAASESLQ